MERRSRKVLVIGGGAAGCAAAAELARMGSAVTMVEPADRLGGLAASHCCKSRSRCERCDSCLPYDMERKVRNEGAIEVLLSSAVVSAASDSDGVQVVVQTAGGRREERFGAVIVAIGASAFDPSSDPRLGHGLVEGVRSSLEIDRALRAGTFRMPPGEEGTMAVVQCVGSRDEKHGAPYCSKACCKYGYKLARHIEHLHPGLRTTFFYIDWRPLDGDLQVPVRWEAEGARLVRARPAEIVEREGRPSVRYDDPAEGPREEQFDLVMLTVGLMPPEGEPLATILDVPLDPLGFFPPAYGRVLAAGCCTGPKDIDESVREGIAAAGKAISLLEGS